MMCFKVAPSIAAGNAIIIKSSEKSPLSGESAQSILFKNLTL